MKAWEKFKISSFLKEREERLKSEEANKLKLKRIDKIDFSGKIHLSENRKTKTNMIMVKPGDLVISGINVEKGAIAIYHGKEDVLATIHYSSYEFDTKKIDIGYFKWFLRSKVFKNIVNSKIKGGIKTELKPKKFLPLEIPLPDKETQVKIRDKINNISNEIKELKNIQTSNANYTEKLKQSILQEAVQGSLVSQNLNDEPASELVKKIKLEKERLIKEKKIKKEKLFLPPSDAEIPHNIPNNWVWCRLGEVLEFNYGKGNKDDSGKIPVYGANGILRYCKKPLVNEKCIIIGRKGSAGALNIVEEPCWPSDVSYYVVPPKNTDFKFIFYLLKTLNLENIGKGIKPGLNRNDVYALPIGLPPYLEQKRISNKVDKFMVYCNEFQDKINKNKNNSEKLMETVLKEKFSN